MSRCKAICKNGKRCLKYTLNDICNVHEEPIEELIEDNGILVYPNPSKESITVEFTGNFTIQPEWSVLDLSGKQVLAGNDANFLFHIDISQLKNGYYIFTSNVNGVEVIKSLMIWKIQ